MRCAGRIKDNTITKLVTKQKLCTEGEDCDGEEEVGFDWRIEMFLWRNGEEE
jgi:hypothetical protein